MISKYLTSLLEVEVKLELSVSSSSNLLYRHSRIINLSDFIWGVAEYEICSFSSFTCLLILSPRLSVFMSFNIGELSCADTDLFLLVGTWLQLFGEKFGKRERERELRRQLDLVLKFILMMAVIYDD